MDISATNKPESGGETTEAVDANDARGPSDGSEKDTLENAELQAELAGSGEKNVEFGGSQARAARGADYPDRFSANPGEDILDPGFDENDGDRDKLAKKLQREQQVLKDLVEARLSMSELMAWKEDLRLLAMHHNTLGPYYDNWTKEANLFFRRLVIINKRLETLRKKKRA